MLTKGISFLILAVLSATLNSFAQTPEAASNSVETKPPGASYGIVVDNSGSYRMLLDEVIQTVQLIVKGNGSDDETFLVRFVDSEKIRLLQDFTDSAESIQYAADDMYVEGGQTAILDAVYFSASHLAQKSKTGENRRKFLILITDGEERQSKAKLEDVLSFLKEQKIRVFTLAVSGGRLPKKSLNFLEKIARETNGKSFAAADSQEIKNAVRELNAAARMQ